MDMYKAKEIRPGDLMKCQIRIGAFQIPYERGPKFWDKCKKHIYIESNNVFTILENIPWRPTINEDYFQLKILFDNNVWYTAWGRGETCHLYWEWWPGKWEEFYKRLEEKNKALTGNV